MTKPYDCGGPDRCIDDLCVHSDQGICGRWRSDAFDEDWGEEYSEGSGTMVDLGGGMIVPLSELMEDDE
jgi:hypothetical protein